MSYATQADIIRLYGELILIQVADRDNDGIPEPDAIDSAIALASGEIDTAVSVRYAVPLTTVTADVMRICIDIAIYRLANVAGAVTTEIRQRYEDAKLDLTRLAKGTFGIGAKINVEPQSSETGGTEAFISGSPRLFTRRIL